MAYKPPFELITGLRDYSSWIRLVFYADSCRRFVFWLIRSPFRGRFCSTVEGQNSGTPFLLIIPEGAGARVRTRTRVRVRARTRNGGSAARCSNRRSWP